jgi:signal transduction histidine kinase/ligand-binding sensor domain-containing protein
MWIGTYDGLNRYDGFNFTLYKNNPDDPHSLSGDLVRSIFEDHKKNLFIGTSGGLSRFEWETGHFYNYMNEPSSSLHKMFTTVNKIIEDSLGSLWLATDLGLINFDPKKNKTIKYQHKPSEFSIISEDFVEDVFIDSKSRMWVATRKGLYFFDIQLKKFRHITKVINEFEDYSHTFFWSIAEDSSGTIWFSSSNGLFYLVKNSNENEYTLKRYCNNPSDETSLSNNRVRDLYVDDKGNLWSGTEGGGINLYDRERDRFWHYNKDNNNIASLNNESIWSIYQDNINNYWIGTFGGGINISIYQSDAFVHYNNIIGTLGSLSHNIVTSFCEDNSGRIWIGTDGGGLNLLDNNKGKFVCYDTKNSGLKSNAILDIFKDSKNRIWIGTWDGGIAILNSDSKVIKSITVHNSELPDNNIFSIIEGDNDDLWLGSYTHGLIHYLINEKKFSYLTYENSEINNTYYFVVKKDSKGYLYLGSTNGFQIYLPATGKVRTFKHNPNNPNTISHESIYDILIENDTSVWIATQNGLNHFNPSTERFIRYFKEDGLPNNVVKGLMFDDLGALWITTNFGACQFNYKNKKIRNFTKDDGLQSNEFYFNSINKTKDGAILMGGVNGFNIIYPDKIKSNKNIPNILITGFEILNRPILPGVEGSPLVTDISETEEIILKHNQSVLTFYFAAMDFADPKKNQYAFMMEGFDEDWIYSGNRRTATYTNLDPGRYIFRVKGSNNDYIWNEKGASLKIIILPPWWQTVWFRIFILMFIVSLLIGYYLFKVNALKKQKFFLQKVVLERTKEIEEKNKVLLKQTSELNETNALLEERHQYIEDQNEILMDKTEKLNETNALLEERQQHIEEQATELSRTNEQLVTLNATKDKFFTIIAHDLKNPFNAVLGFCELLTIKYDKYDDAKKKYLINTIFESSKNIYKLLENLLQWSRTQTGSMEFKPEEFDIYDLIVANISLAENLLKDKNLQIIYSNVKNNKVFADKNMTDLVIRNLITNAIKYTDKGLITIECEQNNSHVMVKIIDTGIGIPEEKLSGIFEISSSKSTHGTRGETGTGLGLILCKEFIEKNKGTIDAKSEERVGSTFYFTLPVKPY